MGIFCGLMKSSFKSLIREKTEILYMFFLYFFVPEVTKLNLDALFWRHQLGHFFCSSAAVLLSNWELFQITRIVVDYKVFWSNLFTVYHGWITNPWTSLSNLNVKHRILRKIGFPSKKRFTEKFSGNDASLKVFF